MKNKYTLYTTFAVLFCIVSAPSAISQGVKVTKYDDRVSVEINGKLFTEFWYKGDQHPAVITTKSADGKENKRLVPTKHTYYYPLIGPGGVQMTRKWPIVPNTTDEEHDHPHHRSLWFSHGSVNGIDFWSEEPKAGKIVHDSFFELNSGKDFGIIRSTSKWIAPDGKVVMTDERLFKVYNTPENERLLDFEITLKAPENEDVILGDTKEGSLGIRIAESMRLTRGKNRPGEGHIIQSTGVKDNATWGKRAEWCDYYGPVDGKIVGIAIFDHPDNPRHPTYWHVRDYGLFAANPFGIHDFEKKPSGTGDMKIPAGKSVTYKYRIYIHQGNETEAKVAEKYKEYISKK
ncbi:MAG: PmoA family protein [Verrucomicrobiia bacterium]